MKAAILIAAFLYFVPRAGAVTQHSNSTPVSIIVPGNTTCSKQTIAATAGDVTGNTAVASTSAYIIAVKVTNLDASADIYCSDSSSVAASGSGQGDGPIAHTAAAPFNFLSWGISSLQKWYCISSSGSVSAIVCLTSAK